jgi:hypothetical protein
MQLEEVSRFREAFKEDKKCKVKVQVTKYWQIVSNAKVQAGRRLMIVAN